MPLAPVASKLQIDLGAIGGSLQRVEGKHVGKRIDIKYPESPADRGLTRLKRIPGKADARLKILERWVALQGLVVEPIAASNPENICGTGTSGEILIERLQIVDFVIHFGGNRRSFVAQPNIHGEIWTHSPIVLDISAEELGAVMVNRAGRSEGLKHRHTDGLRYIL